MNNFHTVKVTTMLEDVGTEDECLMVDDVRLTCTAPTDADCRNYPHCDCERYLYNEAGTHDDAGHARVPGQQCSLQGWFENDSTVYVGPDKDYWRDDCVPPVDRAGLITVSWMDDTPLWNWAPRGDK